MKPDAYTKAVLAVLVLCLVAICVAQWRLAAAARGAVALAEEEAERRGRRDEAERKARDEYTEAVRAYLGRPAVGFTAAPFVTV